MKKRLYLACGKTFAKKEEAVAHIFKTYTTTLVRDGMGNVRDANWVSGLRRLEEGKYAPVPYSKNAPESFSLREAMPPVYDQASRGTCAANAGTALVEYYEGCKTRLSVQYLYERMKRAERDAYRIAAEELMSGGVVSNPDMAEEARAIAALLAARQSSGGSVSSPEGSTTSAGCCSLTTTASARTRHGRTLGNSWIRWIWSLTGTTATCPQVRMLMQSGTA